MSIGQYPSGHRPTSLSPIGNSLLTTDYWAQQGGGELFHPNDLGADIRSWLNPTNEAGLLNSAGAIYQCVDASGSGNDWFQSNGAYQPSTGLDSVNGKNVITTVDQHLTSPFSPNSFDAGLILVGIIKKTGPRATYDAWMNRVSPTTNASPIGTYNVFRTLGNGGSQVVLQTTDIGLITTETVISSQLGTNEYYKERINGALAFTSPTVLPNVADNSDNLYIGERPDGIFSFTGIWGHQFVCNPLSASNLEKLEAWAMWDYGLNLNLDASNPYRLTPPPKD